MHNAKRLLESEDSEIPLSLTISMIHRTHMMFINDKIKQMDITAGQIPFLMVLSREEGITQDELAAHFHIDKGTVARALRKLEDKKYLSREIDPENRRRHLIYLTKKGKDTVPKIIGVDKEWEHSMRSKISDDEYNYIFNSLKKMALNCLEKVDKNGERK